ncbi:Cof-type HAD-IIB family hydrolase [Staphylococcus xylosus]|uniref:Cof-type HAD-IIB family hydrolase n=1 Tax=Staphylococcus xylosus TaxID=1288 RepID=UPI000D1D1A76|nr:Cof-type HAD-IIB family hydrolase [Staphylococcus xylosus]PTI01036.1 Cof-type HAD-IIB family hydrolase [Staphylococcus xylosus]
MNIKLIVADMDGTFLNSDSQFNSESFQLLKENCEEHQIRFVFCTGKQCERVESIIGELSKDTFIVGDSATRIKYNGEFIYNAKIENTKGKEIIQTIQDIDQTQTILGCTEKGAYVLNHIPEIEKKIVHGSFQNVTYINDFAEVEDDFLKISVHDAMGNCKTTASQIKHYESEVYIIASDDEWIDIADLGVNKGTTIRRIQRLLQISPTDTIAFGDGLNDIDLFKAAKYKVAMDNAYPELKKEANLIAKNNDEDGVVQTLNLLLDFK